MANSHPLLPMAVQVESYRISPDSPRYTDIPVVLYDSTLDDAKDEALAKVDYSPHPLLAWPYKFPRDAWKRWLPC